MRSHLMTALAAVAGVALSTSAIAQTETVIWNFDAGASPYGQVVLDTTTGTLYGTTSAGGVPSCSGRGCGTAFSLSEKRGVWRHHVLYAFGGGIDGWYPSAGLVEDSAGALYGTTFLGGSSGHGTAFQLSFNGSSWVHTVLHSFGVADGSNPDADLVIDKATGAIYGTTILGGAANCGTVFELPPSGGESVLYAFKGGNDGCNPATRVREDSKGRLYGVTVSGGTYGQGIAYMLKESFGAWSESVLYSFSGGSNGQDPNDLDMDPTTGVLYGTTAIDGVFELTKTKSGWRENVLYNFQGKPDGLLPIGLHLDPATGVLYGTTLKGGTNKIGTVFQLTKNGGSWVETQLHSFSGRPGDGKRPYARPTEDPKSTLLYGTTSHGGARGGGTVYLITP